MESRIHCSRSQEAGAGAEKRVEGPGRKDKMLVNETERTAKVADRKSYGKCRSNIVRYANGAGRQGSFNIRHLINRWFDRYLYQAGFVESSLPFDELRRKTRINDAAGAADDDPDFSVQIRESPPGGNPKGGARW